MAGPNQPNLDELMKMAQKMQTSMKSAHDELASMRIKGEAGGGLVKITINGKHQCLRARLDGSLLKEEVEVIEDLITAAINDAVNKVEKAAQEKMMGLSKELGLPEDYKLPEGEEGGDEGGESGSSSESGGNLPPSSSSDHTNKEDDSQDDEDDGFGGFGSK